MTPDHGTSERDNVSDVIETERLVLRRPRSDDVESLLEFVGDEEVMRRIGDEPGGRLPAVHRVASLVKRWLLGTHGGIGAQHVEVYLDEFIFRFNRRQSNARGLLFYRLLQNAVVVKKLDETLVWSRRGQAGKRRGPQPKPKAKRAPKGRAAMRAPGNFVMALDSPR